MVVSILGMALTQVCSDPPVVDIKMLTTFENEKNVIIWQ